MEIIKKLSPPKPSVVYDTYWKFAAERMNIFHQRFQHLPAPWTKDPILSEYKFTNAYRVLDRVSQYLVKNVIPGNQEPKELFFRILLFKIFNKIETWELLQKELGEITFKDYSFDRIDDILTKAMAKKISVFSGAYMMCSGRSKFGYAQKHRNYLKMLNIASHTLPIQLKYKRSLEEVYKSMLRLPMLGEFLAFQFTIDINYSSLTDFSEMDFVAVGPGAKDGIRKCFTDYGDYKPADIVKMMADKQEDEFKRLGLEWKNLFGRPLQLIDCQNLFCETDKYSRVAHPEVQGLQNRTRIKQKYDINAHTPKLEFSTPSPIEFVFPEKWGLKNNQANS